MCTFTAGFTKLKANYQLLFQKQNEILLWSILNQTTTGTHCNKGNPLNIQHCLLFSVSSLSTARCHAFICKLTFDTLLCFAFRILY